MNLISFIEGLAQKIKEDPSYDHQRTVLNEFTPNERTILEAGSYIRGRKFDVWAPERGITNVFEGTPYDDPDGLLPLSISQMKKF